MVVVLLLLLQLDESATRVPRALMLRSGPVLRAFPEKQSICKVGRGEKKKKKKIFSGDFTPTHFAFPL